MKAMWNMHERAVEELPKTNNHVEGFHRKMLSAVSAQRPNIWNFLDVLKKEQGITNVTLNQIVGGRAPPPQRRKYQENAQRVLTVVRDFNNLDLLDFLRGITYVRTISECKQKNIDLCRHDCVPFDCSIQLLMVHVQAVTIQSDHLCKICQQNKR